MTSRSQTSPTWSTPAIWRQQELLWARIESESRRTLAEEVLMTNLQAWRTAPAGEGYRWLSAAASVAVGAAFFSLWFWLLPRWLGFSVEMAGAARWRWLAAVPSVLGFAVALR